MVDLHSILHDHHSKRRISRGQVDPKEHDDHGSLYSEIPNQFFDQILQEYKLTRIEIMVLMYLYRQVWCRPNIYKEYGISQLMSYTVMCKKLNLDLDDIRRALNILQDYGFISIIRSGQYFVRKYFTRENDGEFGQTYDDFEI